MIPIDHHLTVALLAEFSPAFRRLVLKAIFGRIDGDEEADDLLRHISSDPLVSNLADVPTTSRSQSIRRTAIELRRLAQCGVPPNHSLIRSRVEAIFAKQSKDGSWPLGEFSGASRKPSAPNGAEAGYAMIPLQTAIPLHAIAVAGYATDRRSEAAYEWLIDNRIDDGSWPTGQSGGVLGRVAGYRLLAHSRWGCRSNTTGALLALSYHPTRRSSDAALRALELVLGSRGLDRISFGFDLARVLGLEENGGMFTYFGRFDVAQILGICARVGGGAGGERIKRLIEFAETFREESGLFTHPTYPQLSRWLTLEMIVNRRRIDESRWIGTDAVTPEPRKPRRRY